MKRQILLILLGLIFIAPNLSKIMAQGNLLITPSRITFEGQKQKEDLNITNVGTDSATYVVSMINYKMRPDGSFQLLAKGDSLTSADKYLRIFPRKIKLAPNESQTIRLQYRKPSDIKPGEYRSHVYFRAEKESSPLGMASKSKDSTKMSVQITAIFGISIPVILRVGDTSAQNAISDIHLTHLTDSTSVIKFNISRLGNCSSYGNIKVDFIGENNVSVKNIAIANGVGVYTEINSRTISLLTKWPYGLKHTNGKLVIRYLSPDDEKFSVLATADYQFSSTASSKGNNNAQK